MAGSVDWAELATAVWAQTPEVVQVVFWAVGSIVAIKTYQRAKKGLLQPAKTEVFKLQVAKLQSLLDALDWNGEADALSRSGVGSSFDLNVQQLVDAYALTVGLRPSDEDMKRRPKSAAQLLRAEVANKELMPIEVGAKKSANFKGEVTIPEWGSYRHRAVQVSQQMQGTLDTINRFQSDPVIPSFVAEQLKLLREEIVSALGAIGDTMDQAADLIPKHYRDADAVRNADWHWIHNLHPAEARYDFYQRVASLRSDIRSYLKSDQMFDL